MRFPDSFLDQLRAAVPVIDAVQRRYKLRKAGSAEWVAIDDKSLTVNTAKNLWHDFGKGQTGGDIFDFVVFDRKCTFQEAVEDIAQFAGIPIPGARRTQPARGNGSASGPIGPEPPPADPGSYGVEIPASAQARGRGPKKEITKTYSYVDADGLLMYQVCRQEWIGETDGKRKKTFFQRRPFGQIEPDESKQHWVWGLSDGVFLRGRDGNFYSATPERLRDWHGAERIEIAESCPHMLYRLPQLREEMAQDEGERRLIFVTEGEKDVDTYDQWGCVATCNSGGGSNWRPEHAEELRGADVVVSIDNDAAGRKWGHMVALSLRHVAARVRTLCFADHWRECPDGGDVTDWKENGGGTADRLFEIVDKLKDWSPEPPNSNFNAVRFVDVGKRRKQLLWTIKGIIQRATVSLWYGPTQSGKSFLLTDAGFAVARGIHWMGQRTRPGLVIYQTGEGGEGFDFRVQAYREHARIPHDEDVPFVYLPARINLFAEDADVNKLIEEIKAWAAFYDYPLELVVIDTFNAASAGANENANQDVGKVLERCRKIVDATGAHVALVHHTPASGDRPRGHSSLLADVESAVAVAATEQTETEQMPDGHEVRRDIHQWTLAKQKDGPKGATYSFVLPQVRLGVDEDGDPVTSCVVRSLQTAAAAAAKRSVPEGWAVLNPANEDVFRSLVRALRKKGREAPPEIGAPRGELCITIGDWQDEMLELVVGHEEITDTVRGRFKAKIWRASKAWLPDRINLICKSGVWVWRTPRRVHMIDPPPALTAARYEQSGQAPILAPGENVEDLLFR